MLATGRIDHRPIEMPGPDGTLHTAIVRADIADDPH